MIRESASQRQSGLFVLKKVNPNAEGYTEPLTEDMIQAACRGEWTVGVTVRPAFMYNGGEIARLSSFVASCITPRDLHDHDVVGALKVVDTKPRALEIGRVGNTVDVGVMGSGILTITGLAPPAVYENGLLLSDLTKSGGLVFLVPPQSESAPPATTPVAPPTPDSA